MPNDRRTPINHSPEELQDEISYLKNKLADLQQLIAELLLHNEQLRRSREFRS
jgi:prefoldin subunit 5